MQGNLIALQQKSVKHRYTKSSDIYVRVLQLSKGNRSENRHNNVGNVGIT